MGAPGGVVLGFVSGIAGRCLYVWAAGGANVALERLERLSMKSGLRFGLGEIERMLCVFSEHHGLVAGEVRGDV